MAYAITDFSKSNYQYIDDSGNLWLHRGRTVVNAASAGLGATTGAEKGHFPGKERHMTFVSTTAVTETSGKTYFPKRKIVYNTANYATVKASTLAIDGLSFVHNGGHSGERSRSL